jgi:hypothetical protein
MNREDVGYETKRTWLNIDSTGNEKERIRYSYKVLNLGGCE